MGFQDVASNGRSASWWTWWMPQVTCCAGPPADDIVELSHQSKSSWTSALTADQHVIRQQPSLILPPVSAFPYDQPKSRRPSVDSRSMVNRSLDVARRASPHHVLTVRRKLYTDRRPRIGAPTNFVHVSSGYPRKQKDFRPLELSIYLPKNQLSPILPYLDELQPPPPALTTASSSADNLSHELSTADSLPTMTTGRTFSTATGITRYSMDSIEPAAMRSSDWVSQPLQAPPSRQDIHIIELPTVEKALPQLPVDVRRVVDTSLVSKTQLERVQSALLETKDLDRRLKEIDVVIQRQSISLRRSLSVSDEEKRAVSPVPAVPQLPKGIQPIMRMSALNKMHESRRSADTKTESMVFEDGTLDPITFRDPEWPKSPDLQSEFEKSPVTPESPFPPPPLPLMLHHPNRPTSRRKTSFSRVSRWIFNDPKKHGRGISLDSLTNDPKPVTAGDGFYQCVDPTRSRLGSVSSYDSVLDRQPTNWTPGSAAHVAHFADEVAKETLGHQRERSIKMVLEFPDTVERDVQQRPHVGVAF